jgi:hypothetical protein
VIIDDHCGIEGLIWRRFPLGIWYLTTILSGAHSRSLAITCRYPLVIGTRIVEEFTSGYICGSTIDSD